MTTTENFEIRLPLFEGPFDLLLFFIERDELDIYDIPISKITNDFLEYMHRQFHKMEETEIMKEKRGNLMKELRQLAESTNVEAELQDVDLFKLLMVFEKVMKRAEEEKNKPVHQVIQYPYTIEERKEFILSEVRTRGRIAFTDLLHQSPTRITLIFNFLAILEMLANSLLSIQVGEGYNNFWISTREEVAAENNGTVGTNG